MATWVKLCGITRLEDAEAACDAGADAIGLNFVARSPRCIGQKRAREITQAVRDRIEVIGVFVDLPQAELERVVETVGLHGAQLHGSEPPQAVQGMAVPAFKAVRVATADDVELAGAYPGERLLVDSKVPGAQGGTGHVFDWSLIESLCRRRPVIVAGGLTPDNVAQAVHQLKPYGVDTASGVELEPGIKSAELMQRFVAAARS